MNNYKQFLKQHGWPVDGQWTDAQLANLLGHLSGDKGFFVLAARDAIRSLRKENQIKEVFK